MKKTLIMIVLTGLILSACNREETTDDIDQKAVDRWQALIDGDYEKAYEYIAPSYKEIESIKVYQNKMMSIEFSIEWIDAEFLSKECTESVCEVAVNVTYVYSFPKKSMGSIEVEKTMRESWLKSNGRWYFMPSDKKEIQG